MSKEMIIATSPHEIKVALMEEGQAVEIYVEREKEVGLVGSIYKGRVTRVLPGMQSAFIDIGLERDGFLYVSDFFGDLEELGEYERVPAAAADDEPPQLEPDTAVEEAQPPEERQPDFQAVEPPLTLPERRPLGRGPRGRSRHRGGRGRRFGRGRPPAREPAARRSEPARRRFEPAVEKSSEPVLLPGESLAKYRDRVPPATPVPDTTGPEAEPATERIPETSTAALEVPTETTQPEPPAPPLAASPSPPQAEAEPDAEETPEQVSAQPVLEEPSADAEATPGKPFAMAEEAAPLAQEPETENSAASEESETLPGVPGPEVGLAAPGEEPKAQPNETAPASDEDSGREAVADSVHTEVAATAPGEEAQPVEPANDHYPDANTLAEIERVRRYESQVGLPPSVHERTGGNVVWQRKQGAGQRGRERRPRRGRRLDRRPARPQRTGRSRFSGQRRTPSRPTRGQPAIAELLKAGQEIIVQIAKEQMGKKGARITSHVTLPGRFLVFMPTIEHIGVSRKIESAQERSRLRRLLVELKGAITGGFVVRTAAAGCSEEDLREDIDYLVKLWHDLRVRAEEGPAPILLHSDLNLIERLLRDHLTTDYQNIWIDSEEEYAKVVEFVSRVQPALVKRVKLFTKPAPIFEELGVQQEIDRALRPKVWLKSGGYIVINHTEALVAIDVNTGKFVGKGSTRLEDTIVKTNLEAVQEIVRQIRLRDLGGIIVIDFIDMEDARNRQRVMRALEAALRDDRSPSKILSFNEFGLVAITRKRSRQSLERVLCQPCPYCSGIGMVKSLQTLCYEIQAEAKKMAAEMDAPELTIRAHPEIVKTLKGRDNALVRELEEATRKNIILQSDTTLNFDQYNIY